MTCAKGALEPSHLVRPAICSETVRNVVADIDPVDVVGVVESKIGADDKLAEVVEETRAHKLAARPYTPTKAEWEEHLPLHLNYRNWCEDCVRAKGLSAPHKTVVEEPLDGVTWNMDYCFLGDNLKKMHWTTKRRRSRKARCTFWFCSTTAKKLSGPCLQVRKVLQKEG